MIREDKHFEKTYSFIFVFGIVILAYVVMITFLPIPKENQRFVDIALGFLLSLLANNAGYLTGGNPVSKKPDVDQSTNISIDENNDKE